MPINIDTAITQEGTILAAAPQTFTDTTDLPIHNELNTTYGIAFSFTVGSRTRQNLSRPFPIAPLTLTDYSFTIDLYSPTTQTVNTGALTIRRLHGGFVPFTSLDTHGGTATTFAVAELDLTSNPIILQAGVWQTMTIPINETGLTLINDQLTDINWNGLLGFYLASTHSGPQILVGNTAGNRPPSIQPTNPPAVFGSDPNLVAMGGQLSLVNSSSSITIDLVTISPNLTPDGYIYIQFPSTDWVTSGNFSTEDLHQKWWKVLGLSDRSVTIEWDQTYSGTTLGLPTNTTTPWTKGFELIRNGAATSTSGGYLVQASTSDPSYPNYRYHPISYGLGGAAGVNTGPANATVQISESPVQSGHPFMLGMVFRVKSSGVGITGRQALFSQSETSGTRDWDEILDSNGADYATTCYLQDGQLRLTRGIASSHIELRSATGLLSADTWYGLHIYHNGHVETTMTATEAGDAFVAKLVDLTTGAVTEVAWGTETVVGNAGAGTGAYNGILYLGARFGNDDYQYDTLNGYIASCTVAALAKSNVAVLDSVQVSEMTGLSRHEGERPGDIEIAKFVRDPIRWVEKYRLNDPGSTYVGNTDYRKAAHAYNGSDPFNINTSDEAFEESTQMWLMGDIQDGVSGIVPNVDADDVYSLCNSYIQTDESSDATSRTRLVGGQPSQSSADIVSLGDTGVIPMTADGWTYTHRTYTGAAVNFLPISDPDKKTGLSGVPYNHGVDQTRECPVCGGLRLQSEMVEDGYRRNTLVCAECYDPISRGVQTLKGIPRGEY